MYYTNIDIREVLSNVTTKMPSLNKTNQSNNAGGTKNLFPDCKPKGTSKRAISFNPPINQPDADVPCFATLQGMKKQHLDSALSASTILLLLTKLIKHFILPHYIYRLNAMRIQGF